MGASSPNRAAPATARSDDVVLAAEDVGKETRARRVRARFG